jgi:cytochrome c biogenesis protein CcmG, thiol:disulfide interchange protein DsbE
MPHLKELYERYKDQGLVLISVHSDKNVEEMRKAVKDWGITWPVAQDKDGKTMKAFVGDSFPDYFVIDRKGKVRVADLANSELDRAIETLIKEKG